MSESKFRSNFHVCIVGAGIVGLAGGILLRKHGFKVTIIEKDAEMHNVGAGIQLHPNAVRVLKDLGVYDRVRSASVLTPAIILKSYRTGETLHTQNLQALEDNYGFPLLTVHRAQLRRILHEAAVSSGVQFKLNFNVDVTGVDLERGVLRLFQDGSPPEIFQADLFVGADGANSVFREVLTGRKLDVVPHGTVVNRILVEEKDIINEPDLLHLVEKPSIITWLGPNSQAVTYSLDGIFNIAFTRPWSTEPLDAFFGSQTVDLEAFKAQISEWTPEICALVGLAKDCRRWMLFEPKAEEASAPWVDPTAKFCVVGDAAHQILPYLAQGAAIGLESVSVLAYLLGKAENKEQVRDCLAIYQQLRKERTGHVIRASLKNGRLWQLVDGPLQSERDREFRNETPGAGYPNLLADPFFQSWLWGFDSREAVEEAWETYTSNQKQEICMPWS
ncbi:MAG: hypothetical protein Q9160_007295 [Pyrenula sp. 1 TL-2023]